MISVKGLYVQLTKDLPVTSISGFNNDKYAILSLSYTTRASFRFAHIFAGVN